MPQAFDAFNFPQLLVKLDALLCQDANYLTKRASIIETFAVHLKARLGDFDPVVINSKVLITNEYVIT